MCSAALAEFERELVKERTTAGLNAARRRGRVGGRRKLLTSEQARQASLLLASLDCNVGEICQTFGVHRSTLYRAIKRYEEGL